MPFIGFFQNFQHGFTYIKLLNLIYNMSRDSSVGIATGYGLESEFESW
jgi:hypothetical protein